MMNELRCAETVMQFRRRVRRTWTTAALLELVGAAVLLVGINWAVHEPGPRGCWALDRPQPRTPEELREETERTKFALRWYADDVYPRWRQLHSECPTIDDLYALPFTPSLTDWWGTPYKVECGPGGFRIWSLGPDQLVNSGDEIGSWHDR